MKNIFYANKEKFEQIKMNFRNDGVSKIHFLADFDRTLTKAYINGKHTPALIGVLRDEEVLGKDTTLRENELYAKYRPQEEDPNINLEEKKEILKNWWVETFNLLIEKGLTKYHIKKCIDYDRLKFRDGIQELLNITNKNSIPIVIISATAFGTYSLEEYFNKYSENNDNISFIGNTFDWGDAGEMLSYHEPVIHSFSKDETIVESFPEIYNKIKNRKNVILLGDSLGDHHMSDGFDYDNILNIGFLNEKKEELMDAYLERYDVVITGDSDINFVNEFLNNILT